MGQYTADRPPPGARNTGSRAQDFWFAAGRGDGHHPGVPFPHVPEEATCPPASQQARSEVYTSPNAPVSILFQVAGLVGEGMRVELVPIAVIQPRETQP